MTWHPTTNRIQTVHLTLEELTALLEWPHGCEFFDRHAGWIDNTSAFEDKYVYRGKPAPVMTSVWLNVYVRASSISHKSREEADVFAGPNRIDVLRIDTCNGVSTAHLGGLK
jgi:hypothetical protein